MKSNFKSFILVCLTAFFLFGFSLWSIFKPIETESVSERRLLVSFPKITKESVSSGEFMSAFEKYSLDHFPLRDSFRTLKAITSFYVLSQKDNNDIYIVNGSASRLEYPIDIESIKYASEKFTFVYESCFSEKNNIYISVIPDKNYFMAKNNGYPSIDYEEFINYVTNETEFANYINILPLLELSDYYYTDTHWRQEKILDVAQYLAKEMGVPLTAEYSQKKIDTPFYGVYYGQSALPLSADELYYLDSSIFNNCSVYDFETQTNIPIYDFSKVEGNDPYEMFLSGSKSLLSIENQNSTTDKELVIFRDSFGSSIAPLFTEGYKKVTLVDIRYISSNILDKFITFENQDVLFLYSTSVLNNSITIK